MACVPGQSIFQKESRLSTCGSLLLVPADQRLCIPALQNLNPVAVWVLDECHVPAVRYRRCMFRACVLVQGTKLRSSGPPVHATAYQKETNPSPDRNCIVLHGALAQLLLEGHAQLLEPRARFLHVRHNHANMPKP